MARNIQYKDVEQVLRKHGFFLNEEKIRMILRVLTEVPLSKRFVGQGKDGKCLFTENALETLRGLDEVAFVWNDELDYEEDSSVDPEPEDIEKEQKTDEHGKKTRRRRAKKG